MRDFRDAKAMAHILRAALAAKGFKVTISQSLELIAEIFGAADWNTLAAAIRQGSSAARQTAFAPPPSSGEPAPKSSRTERSFPPVFSRELELTFHRAIADADQRGHEYATLEHLLRALIDDADASAVMKACKVDLGALRANLVSTIDNELRTLAIDDERDPVPTPAFQRVVKRAVGHVEGLGRDTVTAADVLVAIFDEKESHAVWLLAEQEMTQQDAANFIAHDNLQVPRRRNIQPVVRRRSRKRRP